MDDLDLLCFDVFDDEAIGSDTNEEAEESNSLEAGASKIASKRLLKKDKVHITALLK